MNSIRAVSRLSIRPTFDRFWLINKNLTDDFVVTKRWTHNPPQTHDSSSERLMSLRPDVLYRHLWIKCSCHEPTTLDSYEAFMIMAAKHLDINYVKTTEPFRCIKRRTLLASRFVHKKYRVQYEHRTYYRHLEFKNLTGSTADTFLEYVERNLPEGVLMIAERHKLGTLPFDTEIAAIDTQTNVTNG